MPLLGLLRGVDCGLNHVLVLLEPRLDALGGVIASRGDLVLQRDRDAAEHGLPRAGTLGPEGTAWLRRARAELTRLTGPDPDAWQEAEEAWIDLPLSGPGFMLGSPDCTPGYYNSEGQAGNRQGFFSDMYGAGPLVFFQGKYGRLAPPE